MASTMKFRENKTFFWLWRSFDGDSHIMWSKKRPKKIKLRFQRFLVLIFLYLKYTEGGNFDEKISKSHYTNRILYKVHDNKHFENRPSK